jgi:hypothetical protein
VLLAAFPAASWAVTVILVDPGWMTNPLTSQLLPPIAVPLSPRSVTQVTWTTPTLSDAVPPSEMVLLGAVNVAPDVGDVMLMTGGTVSAGV